MTHNKDGYALVKQAKTFSDRLEFSIGIGIIIIVMMLEGVKSVTKSSGITRFILAIVGLGLLYWLLTTPSDIPLGEN